MSSKLQGLPSKTCQGSRIILWPSRNSRRACFLTSSLGTSGLLGLSASRQTLLVRASLLQRGLEGLLPVAFLKQPREVLIFWMLVFYSLLSRFGQDLFYQKNRVFMYWNYVLFVFNQIQDCFRAESPIQTQTGEPLMIIQHAEYQCLPVEWRLSASCPYRQKWFWHIISLNFEWLLFLTTLSSWENTAKLKNRCIIIHSTTLSLNILFIPKLKYFHTLGLFSNVESIFMFC